MEKFSIKLFSITILLAIPVTGFAASTNLQGNWRGLPYDIELDDTFDDVEGHWGDRQYDINISSTFSDISGSVDDVGFSLDWSTTFGDFSGTLPCGDVDVDFSYPDEVEGTLCGYHIAVEVPAGDSAYRVARDIVIDELLQDFPSPTRSVIRRFIFGYMQESL